MKHIIFLFVIIATLCIPSVIAMEINLAKNSYFPGETFQANITGDFTQQLTVNNIFFMTQEKEVGLAFYLLKISEKEYWVYVDLPQQTGNYTFSIKNALYKEDGVLKGNEKEKAFEIKQTISYFYKDIQEKIVGKFQTLSVEDNSFGLLALAYDDNLASQAKDALLSKKSTSNECFLSTCKVKDTAIALWALKKSSVNAETSWLIDAQNNLDIGLWSIAINSQVENQCDILINSDKMAVNLTAGDNTISLNLKNKPDDVAIKVNCSVLNAKIVHTYLGKINEFPMQKQENIFTIMLNNKKCFGQFYRSDCDVEATSYAIIALDVFELDKSDALNWLKNNAQTNKEKSIALYFGDSEMKEWLLNNQHNSGYFTEKSLAESPNPDIEATIFAVWALQKVKENDAVKKGETWLKSNIYGNLTNELKATAFVFLNNEIESILSVNPAIIKTKINSNISITAKNKGITDLTVSANFVPFNTKKDFSLKANKEEKIEFAVPSKLNNKEIKENISGSIDLSYTKFISGKYTIPVLIFADKNLSTDFVIEVPKEHFRFLQQEINLTFLTKENNLIPITLKNFAPQAVKNVVLSYSRDLDYVMNLTSLHISEIDAGSELTINLVFQSQKTGNYQGFIQASSGDISATLPINVTFTKNESEITKNITAIITEKNKTCKDYNGTICKNEEACNGRITILSEGRCCIGKCEKKKNLKGLGIIMIVLAVFIIGISFLTKLKKPKKEMKDVLSEIEKKYDKFTPPRSLA